MNIEIRDHFIRQWKKYFNNTDLPITFYYSDDPAECLRSFLYREMELHDL